MRFNLGIALALLNGACSAPEKGGETKPTATETAAPGSSQAPDLSATTSATDTPPAATPTETAVQPTLTADPVPVDSGTNCAGPRLDLTDIDASAGPYEKLEGDWSGVGRLASHGSDVYLMGSAGLQVLRGGMPPAQVVTAELPEVQQLGFTEGRNRLIVDDDAAYFVVKGGIARAGLDGSPVEIVLEGVPEEDVLTDLLLAGDSLFFGWSDKGIYRMPKAGGAEPALVTDTLDFLGYTIAGDTLYGGADNGLFSMPIAGGMPTLVTSFTAHIFPYVGSITVQDEHVYWRDDITVLSCPLSDCSAPTELFGNAEIGLEVRGTRAYAVGDALQYAALDGTDCGTLIFGAFPDELGVFTMTDEAAYTVGTFDADPFTTQMYRVPLQ